MMTARIVTTAKYWPYRMSGAVCSGLVAANLSMIDLPTLGLIATDDMAVRGFEKADGAVLNEMLAQYRQHQEGRLLLVMMARVIFTRTQEWGDSCSE